MTLHETLSVLTFKIPYHFLPFLPVYVVSSSEFQNVIDRLGKPWGNCTNGDNTKHSHEFFEYSHKACKEQCFQKKLIEACGCVTDVNYVDTPKCSYLNETQRKSFVTVQL